MLEQIPMDHYPPCKNAPPPKPLEVDTIFGGGFCQDHPAERFLFRKKAGNTNFAET